MPAHHNITHAPNVYHGAGYYPPLGNPTNGLPVELGIVKVDLGAPETADVDLIIDAATSTELPDTETVTYTYADDGTTPLDNADTPVVSSFVTATGATVQGWALDVPRNLSLNVTHSSSIVAMTCTVTGYDQYGELVVEDLAVTATGTTKTTAGKKAFKFITSVAFTAAADAEANTANLGTGVILGLPYKLTHASDFLAQYADATEELASSTVAAAVTSTATSTTGDVRGTIAPNTVPDDSVNYYVWYRVADSSTKEGLVGVAQYGG